MERNPTANNYGYYKEPVNYPTNPTYGDIYQPTYPYEDELKERRYQQQTNVHYHQNYAKPDQNYKPEKPQSSIKSYGNYNFANYKDGQYPSYYDQYKINMGLPAINNYAKTKDGYHPNYSTGMFPDSKVAQSYCDEANISAKAPLIKPTNPQISQYMYTNCYGYPAASYQNQNYCSYAQSCNDEARMLWDDYQTNRRLLSSYVPAPPHPPPPPTQANCRLKDNYNSDYYGSAASSYQYHAEGLRNREKLLYTMNSHASPSDNLYNSRPIWPLGLQYQSMPQNMMMNSYDRLNYISDAQNFDYCSPRQDTTAFHPAYAKPPLVGNSTQKHIRPAAMSNDYYNSQRYYLCNEQLNNELQDAYSQQCLRDTRHNITYNHSEIAAAAANGRTVPVPEQMISKEPVYNSVASNSAYYNQTNQGSLNLTSYADNTKSTVNKGQNLREFLASWNEDEDDGIEKIDGTENQIYLQQTNVENATVENHLQFKGSFNTRPKIHVGITVDSNVANNQYIILPDIIIDIEKSKEGDHIQSHVETQHSINDKVVLLETIDVPVTELSQYANISLVENVMEKFDASSSVTPIDAADKLALALDIVESLNESSAYPEDVAMKELPKETTPKKMKRHKRIFKPKTLKRLKRSTRTTGRTEKSKQKRMIRIRKVWQKIKMERSMLPKKAKTKILPIEPTTETNVEHSNKNEHSAYQPKTLKHLSLCSINSENGREFLKKSYIEVERKAAIETKQRKSFVPKLSVLCEFALNNYYEEKNILLLNLDELDSNLYFVECDINENLLSTQNDSIESDFIELLIDDDDDDDENDETTTNHSCNSNLDNFNEICLTSDENSRDFSSLHHEEIVPDNLHAFENEKLLKYLQSKYIQKHNYLKIFIIDKICKKYRKYILKRRRQQETTKKFLLSKIKEKFITKKKHFKIGSC